MTDIKIHEPLWGAWYVDKQLGEGSFGKVYKVHKEEFGRTYEAAVKIISIPQSEADILQAKSEGLNDESARSYFQAFVTDIIQEIDLMSAFRGNSNVVSLEDHTVIEHKDKIGWDILIRMELLDTLSSYVTKKPMTQAEVIKLGIHICRALELCAKHNTIHRDIKPDNIFVSPYGDYKLGDFGIARQIERTMSGLSKKGTYQYMAPEVFKGGEYGASVDIYSLGIVMYRFLNKNRAPFLPAFPDPITPRDREDSLLRRMNGEPIPPIQGINEELNSIVLKACAYDRKERFKNVFEMKQALEEIHASTSILSSPIIVSSEFPNPEIDNEDEDYATSRTDFVNDYENTGEKTEIIFSHNKISPTEQPAIEQDEPEIKISGKILNILSTLSSICLGALTILTLFSNTAKDIFTFVPLYVLCLSQCVLKFRNKVINYSFMLYITCYLLLSVLINFQFFDYYFLIFVLCLLPLIASKDKKLGIIHCSAMVTCASILCILILQTSKATHYTYIVGTIAIPFLMLISSPMSLLLMEAKPLDDNNFSTKNIIGVALLISLQFFLFIVYVIGHLTNAQIPYYILDANFPGFSPERFSWWSSGRFIGILLQFCAFSSLLSIATASITPTKFLRMISTKNLRKISITTTIIITLITALTILLVTFQII